MYISYILLYIHNHTLYYTYIWSSFDPVSQCLGQKRFSEKV